MITTEKQLLRALKRKIPGKYTAIENSISSGIPDISACIEGKDIWIELKIMHGNHVLIRPSQVNWIRAHHKAGGLSWVLSHDKHAPRLYKAINVASECNRDCINKSKVYSPDLSGVDYSNHWPNIKQVLIGDLQLKSFVL